MTAPAVHVSLLPMARTVCFQGDLDDLGDGSGVLIRCAKKIHFFRALGLLLEALEGGGTPEVREEPQFDMNGVMIDVSQGNARMVSASRMSFTL